MRMTVGLALGWGVFAACTAPTAESPNSGAGAQTVARRGEQKAGTAAAPGAGHVQASAEAPAVTVEGVSPRDLHYGVYLNGSKVGWMRTEVRVAAQVTSRTELHASVGGMGRISKVRLIEERTFDAKSRLLSTLSFEQQASTGSVKISGRVGAGVLRLTTTAGGASHEKDYPVNDSLDGEIAAEMLVRDAIKSKKVGATVSVKRFDASVQQTIEAVHEVIAIEERIFAGVPTPVVRLRTRLPSMGLDEQSWVDGRGRTIESKVGGFFVARLESAVEAKRLDYSQDILVSAVVKAPRPVRDAETRKSMTLVFEGFGASNPPSSHRQAVDRQGQNVRLRLRRDEVPKRVPLRDAATAEDSELIAPTAFIQSDAVQLRAKAREVVGDATDVFTATERLTHWVFEHVRDEYVPAYSNALEALESGRGDCTEHSVLFVAMARSLGIPARVAVGIAYWPAGDGYGWHAWSEVRAGGQWYSVDPTWDQPIADVTHVKLAGGEPAEQARIVMLLGQLKIVSQS